MGSLEEIFARQKFAVKMDRKREMPRSGLDLGAKIAEPFLGHGDDDLCPRPDPTAFNSQRLRSFPGVRWDGHCPALVCDPREGPHGYGPAGKAEHTHAGRVLALRDLVTPARAPKRDEGSRVVATAAIVGDVEARAALMLAHMNFDPSDDRAAGRMEQLVEDIGDDRTGVVQGKSVSCRIDLGGRRTIQKKITY